MICTRLEARWAADVCKVLPGSSYYSLLCSWASGRNEVRARGWHGQAMDKRVGGEGSEWEDARDAAAEMVWNGAAIWHACTWSEGG